MASTQCISPQRLMLVTLTTLLLLTLAAQSPAAAKVSPGVVIQLMPNGEAHSIKLAAHRSDPQIFCVSGLLGGVDAARFRWYWRWLFAFHSVVFRVAILSSSTPDAAARVRLYLGENATVVAERIQASQALLYKLLPIDSDFWKDPWLAAQQALTGRLVVPVPAYSPACVGLVGIDTLPEDTVYTAAVEAGVSPARLAAFTLGCGLLAWAPVLCRQAAFYYTTGTLLGTLLSMALVVLMINRLLPLRRLLGPLVLAGATCMSLVWSYVASHLAQVAEQHKFALLAYLACSCCVSLAVCYWLGPVTNPRTFRIADVAMRLVAFAFMHFSCQVWELPMIATLAVLTHRPTSRLLVALALVARSAWPLASSRSRLALIFWRWCPRRIRPLRKRRRLTPAEYERQGREYTEQALGQLRAHCSSPECDAWRVTSRLRDPTGFARFMQGGCHLTLDSDVTSDESSEALSDRKIPPAAASSPHSLPTSSPYVNGTGKLRQRGVANRNAGDMPSNRRRHTLAYHGGSGASDTSNESSLTD